MSFYSHFKEPVLKVLQPFIALICAQHTFLLCHLEMLFHQDHIDTHKLGNSGRCESSPAMSILLDAV